MFSGVAFAIETTEAYTIADGTWEHEDITSADLVVSVSVADPGTGNIDDFQVEVVAEGTDTVQTNLANTDLAITSGNITLPKAALGALNVGNYTIRIFGVGSTQTVSSVDYTVSTIGATTTGVQDLTWSAGANTATVTVGTITVTKNDQDKVDEQLTNISNYTCVEGTDTNVNTTVKADLVTNHSAEAAMTVELVAPSTTQNANIAANGDITYGDSQVVGPVKFKLTLNGATAEKEVQVTVPITKVTAAINTIKALAGKADTTALTIQNLIDAGLVASTVKSANELRYETALSLTEKSDGSDDPEAVDTTEEIQTLVNNMNRDLKVVLDNHDNIDYTSSFGTHTITGKILNSDGALVKVNADVQIVYDDSTENDGLLSATEKAYDASDDGHFVDVKAAKDGVFSITVNTNNLGQFLVFGVNSKDAYFVNAIDDATTYDKFRVLPQIELASPETLEYPFPVKGQKVISGVFVDENGVVGTTAPTLTLNYVGANDKAKYAGTAIPATANFVDKSSFGFLFDGARLNTTGDIGIYYDGILLMKGKVKVDDLNVTMNVKEVPKALESQNVKLTFDLSSTYYDKDHNDLQDNYQIYYTITAQDETITDGVAETLLINNDSTPAKSFVADKQEVEISVPCDAWELGKYDVKVTLKKVSPATVVKETTLELKVVKPAKYNLISWSETDLEIQTYTFDFGAKNDEIDVRNVTGDAVSKLEVIFEGAGIEKTTVLHDDYDDTTDNIESFEVKPTQTGAITFTINVYGDTKDKDTTPDYTFTRELKVVGWNVEVTPTEVLVDTENTFTVTVTDEEGNPVNNADIYIDGTREVECAAVNVVGGVYTIKDYKFTTVDTFDVAAHVSNGAAKVTLDDKISVVGDEVYTVTSDKTVLLNGIQEKIKVAALDENGDVIYPTFTQYDYNSKDELKATTVLSVGTRSDEDGDKVKETVELTVTPHKDAVKTIIRATNAGNKEKGEATIEVKKPLVVHTGATTITENFKTAVEFTVVDPRDNSVMDVNVTILDNSGYVATHTVNTALAEDGDHVWTAEYTDEVSDAANQGWDKAKDDEATIDHDIMMGTVKLGTLEIVKATLTSDPEEIIIGSGTNITLTYTDADGNPIKEYDIELDGEAVGETDENGQVMYAASSTTSLALTFKAATDVSGQTVDLKVKSGADVEAPVATYEVSGNTAIITITDNVRIMKSMVNGELVDMFFPMPSVSTVVTGLKTGENNIEVLSGDINNNFLQTTLTITVEATVEPVSFTLNEDTDYGVPVKVEATTMVPVRFAEQLGATVAWNAETETVTYKLGETEISMTIGSKTAVVNGENVQLPVAPFYNDANRTMVPVRMIATELGFTVNYVSDDAPITIE
jgi:copper amine oxidase-like protein